MMPGFISSHFERILSSPIAVRVARGAIWSLLGAICSRGLAAVSAIFIARMLGHDVFGELGTITRTIMMLQLCAGLGMGVVATKFLADLKISDLPRAGRVIGLASAIGLIGGSITAFALMVFAPWIASAMLGASHLAAVLKMSAISLLLGSMTASQTGVLSGFEAFRTIAKVNVISGFSTAAMMLAGVYWWQLEGAIWGFNASMTINFLLNGIAVRREAASRGIILGYRGCFSEIGFLWKFGLPSFLSAMLVIPVNWVCQLMLVNRPGGFGQSGILDAANYWFSLLVIIPQLVGQSIFPVLCERIGADDIGQCRKLVISAVQTTFFIVSPLVIVGAIFSDQIVQIYGSSFSGNGRVLAMTLIGAGVFALMSPIGILLMAMGKVWECFLMNLGWAILFVSLTYVLIERGALGVAEAKGIAYLLQSVCVICYFFVVVSRLGSNSRARGKPRPEREISR
jgi:O-antigen/teichoic acid export membrane protein